MRETIFQAIITMLKTATIFQGEDGTVRVYDWAVTAPDGYPYVVLGSTSLESSVLDNASDMRRYNYSIQIVGEKFGEPGGLTQSDALKAMRTAEDQVLGIFDAKNALGVAAVTRSLPEQASYGFTDGNSRVVYTMDVRADARVLITL